MKKIFILSILLISFVSVVKADTYVYGNGCSSNVVNINSGSGCNHAVVVFTNKTPYHYGEAFGFEVSDLYGFCFTEPTGNDPAIPSNPKLTYIFDRPSLLGTTYPEAMAIQNNISLGDHAVYMRIENNADAPSCLTRDIDEVLSFNMTLVQNGGGGGGGATNTIPTLNLK